MTTYLLDTDVFIRAKNQHYGFDLCPGFWNWIDREHAAGKVFSIEMVYKELLPGEDELSEWARQRKGMFLKPDQWVTSSLRWLSTWANGAGFRQGAVTAFMQKADFYLVAQAHAMGHTVVTYEKPAPQSVKSIKDPGRLQGARCRLDGSPRNAARRRCDFRSPPDLARPCERVGVCT